MTAAGGRVSKEGLCCRHHLELPTGFFLQKTHFWSSFHLRLSSLALVFISVLDRMQAVRDTSFSLEKEKSVSA